MASNLGSRVAFATPLETRHVRIWLAVVFVSIAIGTAGYMLIEGWSLSDAIYMTVSTLATVGFGEVQPLDEVGRAWTILLMVTGVGIIFGTIGIVAEAVVGEVASGRREARQVEQSIAALRDHYIVCGYGRVGSTVARELLHGGERSWFSTSSRSRSSRRGATGTWWCTATRPRTRR